MIRALVEQTFDQYKKYFVLAGSSQDTKPTAGVVTGSKFLEVDTGTEYAFDEASNEWIALGLTPEEAKAAIADEVSDWLDAHPEATTTVEDGAITYAKLDASLQGSVDDVSSLKSAVDASYIFTDITPTWHQGYLKNADGTTGSDNNYCYCDYILANGGKYTITGASGYNTKVVVYNSSNVFKSVLVSLTSDLTVEYTPDRGDYFRIQFGKGNSATTPESITSAVFGLVCTNPTDVTLTTINKPADAKITGDKFRKVTDEINTLTGKHASLVWNWGQINSTSHTRMHTEKINIAQNSVLFVPQYIGQYIYGILTFYDSNGTKITTSETASWKAFNTELPSELKYYVVSKSAATMQIEIRKTDNSEITSAQFVEYANNISVVDVDNYSVINFYPKIKGIDKTLESWLLPVDTDTESETGKTDMRSAIMSKLTDTGYCKLAPGIYYVSGGIDMPAGSKLEGCGKNTIIRLLQSASYNYIVKARIRNTIRDIRFSGSYTDMAKPSTAPNWPPAEGTNSVRHGIVYGFGVPSQDARDSKYTVIENCVCENFTGAGFYGYASGAIPYQGLSMTNSTFKNCMAGMDFAYGCEYNRITNCQTYDCYYGCINNCGNNVFVNCTFDGQVGFIIDPAIKINNSDDDPTNLAHGSLIGCLFNHIGSGYGYAISMTSVRNDFIIDGCQFWYSNIYLKYCRGIMISNCVFGGRTQTENEYYYTHIVIESGNDASVDSEISKTIILSSCFFHYAPVFELTGIMDNVKAVNSYDDYYGTEIVVE